MQLPEHAPLSAAGLYWNTFAEGSLTVHVPGREKDAAYRAAEELRPSLEQLSELAGPYRSEEIAPV